MLILLPWALWIGFGVTYRLGYARGYTQGTQDEEASYHKVTLPFSQWNVEMWK